MWKRRMLKPGRALDGASIFPLFQVNVPRPPPPLKRPAPEPLGEHQASDLDERSQHAHAVGSPEHR